MKHLSESYGILPCFVMPAGKKSMMGKALDIILRFKPVIRRFTLPETNIASENGWLEYYFPFGMAYFQVRKY